MGVAALAAASADPALACACCSDRGARHVGTAALEDDQRAEIDRVAFGPSAALFTGAGEADDVAGIANPDADYTVAAMRKGKTITFTFKGKDHGGGTLSMALLDTVAFFEVDTRDTPDTGLGLALYKEWKFTAEPTGTGDFAAGAGAGQHLTLILQGHGNNCAAAEDFTHWTLVMEGAKGAYMLFGDMAAPK